MTLPVVLRPEATRDVEQARVYLEAQRAGLGQAFLKRVDDAITDIGAMPEIYGIAWRNVRVCRLRKLTYVVYYRVLDDRVEVLAVIHGHRHASAWQSRA